jgi:hypothetical protein
MQALYRSGRTADAMAAYARTERRDAHRTRHRDQRHPAPTPRANPARGPASRLILRFPRMRGPLSPRRCHPRILA